nr:nickel insertion protein [Thermohalobacter berrensis]
MLETNIDDMNPESYSYIIPLLLEKGALDVYLTNIIMKKNRPGIKINVLCNEENCSKLEEILFTETTTLGIRKYKIERVKLNREFTKIKTKYGIVTIKKALKDGETIKYAPEYEECKKIAEDLKIPLNKVYQEIICEFNRYLNK